MKKSLIQREIVTETVRNRHIESIGTLNFKKENLDTYYSLFEDLVQESIISQGKFEDRQWQIKNKQSVSTFIFDLDLYSDIQFALKCWVLLKKSTGIGTTGLLGLFNKIKGSIIGTNGFSTKYDCISDFEHVLRTSPRRVSSVISSGVLEFLSFIEHPSYDIYFELCDPFICRTVTVRNLPPYQDILMFDDVISRFQLEWSADEKLKYYPIILWWKITKIIPMRPSEFCFICRDCITITSDNKYFLTVPRKKQKPKNNQEIEITDTLQINEETYFLIDSYKKLIGSFPETPYLLSYHAYCKFLRYTPMNKINKNRFELSQLSHLMDRFHIEIVQNKFKQYDLERITPGDTRHFAFCNMMLQGFNMLSIARIGGHNSLHSQMHYHSHLDYFAESYVYTLTQTNRMKRMTLSGSDLNLGSRELIAKGHIYSQNDFSEIHEVDYGYCTDHPSRCKVGDCRFCDYFFIPKENLMKANQWLKDCSDMLATRMTEQLELMKRINRDMAYNLQTLEYQSTGQEHLSVSANELTRIMEQKAMVDSLLEDL